MSNAKSFYTSKVRLGQNHDILLSVPVGCKTLEHEKLQKVWICRKFFS